MDHFPFEFKIEINMLDLEEFMQMLELNGFTSQLKEVKKQVEEHLN